ncbi:RQC-minor-2 family DNA-binding protein [Bacillus sp. DJP31]|uniref:RQC-minor-2 family DNA-binding protein n=1 Tax=Bacillus sp. DJP31 TaxID=3409789 RepID=UPI003BB492F5
MTLPTSLTYYYDDYPNLLLVPVGRKNQAIRSIGHKNEKATLARINDIVHSVFECLHPEEHKQLWSFLTIETSALPIPIDKTECIYPHLIKPQMFLWNTLSSKRGIPLHNELFYKEVYETLSTNALRSHVTRVIEEYIFCSKLSQLTRIQLLEKIENAYNNHPLVILAREKQMVIDSVENMNKSSLLGLLNPPEEVTYWRQRLEIIMRAFRLMPKMCKHHKELTIQAQSQSLMCECYQCNTIYFYNLQDDRILFPEEFDVEKARKRIETIERQFNEFASNNESLLEDIRILSSIQNHVFQYKDPIDEIIGIQQRLESISVKVEGIPTNEIVTIYEKLKDAEFPDHENSSLLQWLSHIELTNISVLKEAADWERVLHREIGEDLQLILQTLNDRVSIRPKPSEVVVNVKDHKLSIEVASLICSFISQHEDEFPAHVLTKVFVGHATNMIRTQQLHTHQAFGVLSAWPGKYVMKALQQLEKKEYLTKHTKGYKVTEKARWYLSVEFAKDKT